MTLPDLHKNAGSCGVLPVNEPAAEVALHCGDASSLLRLSGAIDICSAAELQAALVKALEAGSSIRVSIQDGCDLDVTAIQLLWAARRDAAKRGIEFVTDVQAPAALDGRLRELGVDGTRILL